MGTAHAHVEIDLTFSPLIWMLFFVSPRLSIDGVDEKRDWGRNLITLPPGHHVIEAWFPYLFPGKVCRGSIALDLAPGGSYKLRYRPTRLFSSGKITLVDQPKVPAAIAL